MSAAARFRRESSICRFTNEASRSEDCSLIINASRYDKVGLGTQRNQTIRKLPEVEQTCIPLSISIRKSTNGSE